ncbi:hypothetical protein BGX29_009083 [Mortierella sp. GBA35]|nr:hypothetical protein BGX29_009083 [Mortierella sp. GBA35]
MTSSLSSESTQLETGQRGPKQEIITPSIRSNKNTSGETGQTDVNLKTELNEVDIERQEPTKEPQLGKKAAILLFIGLAMATFLASLDGTIIATALPKIASDFKAQKEMSWVATAYLLTFNAFQPLYGKFSDIFGRKAMILFACVTFMVGSAGAGGAQTMTMLILFRAIQGLGGSGLLSIVLIIISDIFPLEERPKYQSVIWSVFGVSSVVGPLLGGVFVEQTTWRWCFLINLPLGVITLASVIIFLRLPFERQQLKEQLARIDYLGTFLIIISVICVLLPITWGGTTYPWDHPAIISLFCVAVVLIAVLMFIEYKAVEPIIPPRLFKNKTVTVIFAVNFLTGMSFLGVIFYSPIYFQVVKGVSATASGLHLMPMVLGLVFSSIVSGALMAKVGDYRYFVWLGTTMMSVGVGLCMLFDAESGMGPQIGYLLIVGMGIGLILQTCMLAAQAASIVAVQLLPADVKVLVVGAYVSTFQYIFKCITPVACAAFLMSLFIRKLRMLDPSEIIMAAA